MTVQKEFVADERLLELRTHEGVTSSGVSENGKVNIEEGKVKREWPQDETDRSCSEMSPENVLQKA